MPSHLVRALAGLSLAALVAAAGGGPALAQGKGRAAAPAARKRPSAAPPPAAPALDDAEEPAPAPPPAPASAAAAAPTPPAPAPAAAPPAPAPAAALAAPADEAARETARQARRESLDRLRARHDELRDAVFRSRARRETLEQALLSTRLQLALRWHANRNYTLARAELRLDGTRIWDSGDRPVGEDTVVLAPRSVPPGPHVLSLRLEVRSRDNPKLGYTSEQSYTVVLAEGKRTSVELSIDEDGSLPSYNPDIEIDVDVD